MIIDLSISSEDAAKSIAEATGHGRLKITAPLSGWVRGNRFRVTLPPAGFYHPYQPVVSGVIEPTTSGCRVTVTNIQPWLGHLAVVTILLVFLSIVGDDIKALAFGFIILSLVLFASFSFRRSQQKELLGKLHTVFTDHDV